MLLCSCVEVREPTELSFGVVSEVTPGIHVVDGAPCASWGRVDFGVSMVYFVTEMYLTRVWKVDNIYVRTVYHWNLCFVGFPKMYSSLRSMLGFESNWQKCNS